MSPITARRIAGAAVLGPLGLLMALVATAGPAAAHSAGGGALPAPSWLLAYGGVAAILITAVVLRSSWPAARLSRFHPPDDVEPAPPTPLGGGLAGIALLVLVFVAALAGLNTSAANPAPWAVGVVFWVGLPLACVLLGDVFRWINPYVTIVRLLPPRRPPGEDDRLPPAWIPAAFLFSFAWYLLAYYRPGSPRALAMYLAVYSVAALGLGARWGYRWLATGEGFGGLSAAVGRLSPRGVRGPLAPGLAALMVVWLGSVAFDVTSQSAFWIDVLGSSRGWGRTLLDTVGLAWVTAIVAGLYLLVVRVAERGQDARLGSPLGVALVPLAAGLFLAHDLVLLLTEGQNALILISDPFGQGWDLFGTINRTIDYGFVRQPWLRWTQLVLVTAGHVVALVVLHDTALWLLRRRPAMRATWTMAAVLSASIVAGALVVLD